MFTTYSSHKSLFPRNCRIYNTTVLDEKYKRSDLWSTAPSGFYFRNLSDIDVLVELSNTAILMQFFLKRRQILFRIFPKLHSMCTCKNQVLPIRSHIFVYNMTRRESLPPLTSHLCHVMFSNFDQPIHVFTSRWRE